MVKGNEKSIPSNTEKAASPDPTLTVDEIYPFASHNSHYENSEISTRAVHIGMAPDPSTGAVNPPIFLSSTYTRESPYTSKGYDYTRAGNPTFVSLEQQVASLENGKYAIAFSSGLSAIAALLADMKYGESVLAFTNVYGGTYRLMMEVYANYGINMLIAKVADWVQIEDMLSTHKPKYFIFETPTNPLLDILDIERAASIAKKFGTLVVVDNTFATPVLQTPFDFGADVVVHSSTKYLSGHSDIVGGILVTNSKMIKERAEFHRKSVGASPSPFDCWLLSRSLKTLVLRVERQTANAQALAEHLIQHPMVSRVYYPGLKSHPQYHLAAKQMKNGFGGMISVEFKLDTLDKVLKLLASFKIFILAESLGSVESLVDHPYTMTHASIPEAERLEIGLTAALCRFSVGIEAIQDLINDIDTALLAFSA